jgi:hypothetical protein
VYHFAHEYLQQAFWMVNTKNTKMVKKRGFLAVFDLKLPVFGELRVNILNRGKVS